MEDKPLMVRCVRCSLFWPDYATIGICQPGGNMRETTYFACCDACAKDAYPDILKQSKKIRAERLRQRAELFSDVTLT